MSFSSIIQRMPPVTKNLVIINIIVWAFMALVPSAETSLNNYLALHYFSSPLFNPLQIFSYMFLHANFGHLFFNMFALVMFGITIEMALGSKRFLLYYISCGIGAALIQEGVFAIMIQKYYDFFTPGQIEEIITRGARLISQGYNFTDPDAGALNALVNTPTVGASGAIYGVLLAFGMLFPNQPIYFMFLPIPIKAKWLVLGYGVLELFYGITGTATGVAHWAHLGGMIVGVFMILYWRKRGDLNDRWFF